VSLYGGKLTSWRFNAANVLAEIEKKLGQRKPVDTRKIAL
jgi:glycerol-3-phosphate dehydrogenase